jgi:hypothetical protein
MWRKAIKLEERTIVRADISISDKPEKTKFFTDQGGK